MRLAVIGLGRMGRFYARTAASLGPPVELVAVADPDAAARAAVEAELHVPHVFADPLAPLDVHQVDAVIIATPTSTHASLIVAASRAGKAILCEKPLALSLDQTRAAASAVEEAHVVLQVGFMRRFDAGYRTARAAIAAGAIGRPVTFKAIGRDPSCPPLGYADPAHSGGLIVDMAIHDFDLARWLMASEVERVSAEGTLLACPELARVGDIDNAVVNLRFASGAVGNVEVSRNARYGYDVRTEVLGSEGLVRVGDNANMGRVSANAGNVNANTADVSATILRGSAHTAGDGDDLPFFVRRFAHAYRAQLVDFVDNLQHHRPPPVTAVDALAAFEIAHAATLSWQQHRPIDLSEIRTRHR